MKESMCIVETAKMEFKFSTVFVTLINILPSVFCNICGRVVGGNIICCVGYRWDNTRMECLPCAVGFKGNNCDAKCTFPTYGQDCQMVCPCSEKDCDFVNGCSRSLEVSSVSYNFTSIDVKTAIFHKNAKNTKGLDDDYTNFKKCNFTQTKRNESDDLIHAIIGLAIVAVLIIVIYLYTHLLEKY